MHLTVHYGWRRWWLWFRSALLLTLSALADSGTPAPDRGSLCVSNSLPAEIITADGHVYPSPKLRSVMPDGLLIEYRLAAGGTGMTRVKFQELSKSLQQQFGYDPKQASAFETEQARAEAAFSQTLREDQNKHLAEQEKMTRIPVRVEVVSDNPTVDYTYFDTANPRPMSLLRASADRDGSRGATDRHFECQTGVTLRRVQNESGKGIRFAVESVSIHLGLSVSIVLPRTPSPAFQAHEEGHRAIAEHFYTCGTQAAQRIGERVAAREITIRSEDPEKAEAMAAEKVRTDIDFEYLKYTEIPANKANKYYDQLTNFGRNNVDSNDATQRAIARFPATLPY